MNPTDKARSAEVQDIMDNLVHQSKSHVKSVAKDAQNILAYITQLESRAQAADGVCNDFACCPFCKSHNIGLRSKGTPPYEKTTKINECGDCGALWIYPPALNATKSVEG